MQNANIFLMSIDGKIPKDATIALQGSLEQAGENALQRLMFISLKSPVIGLVLSLLFGSWGVDRFYKGDIKLGVGKIALWLISFAALYAGLFLTFCCNAEFGGAIVVVLVFGFCALLAVFVWWIVDIFLVYFGIQKDNIIKIYNILEGKNG